LRADKEAIGAFRGSHSEKAVVDVFEVRLPADLVSSDEERESLFQTAQFYPEVRCFFESSCKPQTKELFPLIRALLGFPSPKLNDRGLSHRGFKLRCGGAAPSEYPSPTDVMWVIERCHMTAIPLKFTAGLHHPIRHFNDAAGTYMHGFINVFVAG